MILRILAALLLAWPAAAQMSGSGGGGITALPSTLTLTSATTAYTAGWMIATATDGTTVVVPSFAVTAPGGTVAIPSVTLSSNDTASTAWAAQTLTVDVWSAAPTFAAGHGDRAAFLAATGAGSHAASYSCTMSAIQSDGTWAHCVSNNEGVPFVTAAAGSTLLYWTVTATSGSGLVTASKVLTARFKVLN